MYNRSFRTLIVSLLFTLVLAGCASQLNSEAAASPVIPTITPNNAELVVATAEAAEEAAPGAAQSPAGIVSPPPSVLTQEQAFITIYERVNPAVVNISVGAGQGSGFVYDAQGHIVTNNHVVAEGGQLLVAFADGRVMEAALIGRDPDSDLAVLKVDAAPASLTTVTLADSDALKVGQIVVAIGSPFGKQGTMTTGIISALDRLFPSNNGLNGARFNIPDIIQTDAAINPGNSGGPLLDLEGRVVGVNTAIESPVRASSGIGFAVPANIVDVVVPQLIANGRVSHPWIGISGTELNAALATQIGVAVELKGVVVSAVTADSPADRAGLQATTAQSNAAGDIIVGIEDVVVSEFDDLLGYLIQHTTVGDQVNLKVWRNGTVENVPLTLEARPNAG